MENTLTNVTLTDQQKQLLVKIITAATPHAAGKEVRNGQQAMEAAKTLIDLGIINYSNDEVTVTDAGKGYMRDENLIDDTEQLTQYGQQLQGQDPSGDLTAPPPPPQASAEQPTEDPAEDDIFDDLPKTESYDLLSIINFRTEYKD